MEFDIKEFTKQLESLTAENKKLQHMKEKYIQYSQRLQELSNKVTEMGKEIEDIANEIDPVPSATKRERSPFVKEALKELYDKLMKGTHVTRALVEKTYPHIDESNIGNLLVRLGDMPNVQKTKDGKSIRLYVKSGI